MGDDADATAIREGMFTSTAHARLEPKEARAVLGLPKQSREEWGFKEEASDLKTLAGRLRKELPANWIHLSHKEKGGHRNETPRGHMKHSRQSGIHAVHILPDRFDKCANIIKRMKAREKKDKKRMEDECASEVIMKHNVTLIMRKSQGEMLFLVMKAIEDAKIPGLLGDAISAWLSNKEESDRMIEEDGSSLKLRKPQWLNEIEQEIETENRDNSQNLAVLQLRVSRLEGFAKQSKANQVHSIKHGT